MSKFENGAEIIANEDSSDNESDDDLVQQ